MGSTRSAALRVRDPAAAAPLRGCRKASSMAESPRLALQELDVFRGFAAVLMIVNHAGYRLWDHTNALEPLASGVLLISSSAPALFFFATGVGVGLRPTCDRHSLVDTGLKAALLFLADQVVFWRAGTLGGVDFFSFIAGSMLIVTVLRLTRHPVRWAVMVASAVLVLRFVIGPALDGHLPATGLVAAVVGAHGQSGVSYPLAPWLVYPLAGLVVGIAYRVSALSTSSPDARMPRLALSRLVVSPLAIAVAIAALGGLGAGMLALRGSVFFHWESMSAAYFVLTVALLALGWALSLLMTQRALLVSRSLSVRGVAAFLVVPIHYALIELLQLYGIGGLPSAGFVMLVLVLIALSLVLSWWVEMWLLRIAGSLNPWVPAGAALVASTCLAAVLLLEEARGGWSFLATTIFQVVVAYGLCRRLTLAPSRPAPVPTPPRGVA